MSWGRNFIGDVKHVVAAGEAAIKQAVGLVDNKVNIAVAASESAIVKALGEGFETAGKRVDEAGNALTALGLHIESSGHFNADGSGSAIIKITSSVIPAAPAEVAPPVTDSAAAGAAPAGSGA